MRSEYRNDVPSAFAVCGGGAVFKIPVEIPGVLRLLQYQCRQKGVGTRFYFNFAKKMVMGD